MKLKQKTLFQCFEKTPSKIKEKSAEEEAVKEIRLEIPSESIDNLRPIHIRQCSELFPSSCKTFPSLPTRRKSQDCSSSLSIDKEFVRFTSEENHQSNRFHFDLHWRSIESTERQMSLFESYTAGHPFIDWRSMFEQLKEIRRKAIEQNQYEQCLWTELYRPRNSITYLGNHTRQVQRLYQWFSHWTTKLQNEQPKKRKRPFDDDEEGDDGSEYSRDTFYEDSNLSFASSIQQKSEHPQLIFIHGSGTTSLVHAIAEEFNFKVTEINGSQSRARTPLLKQLEQVTSHHQLAFKRCPSDTLVAQDRSPLPARKKMKGERNSIKSFFKDEEKENSKRRRCEKKIRDDPVPIFDQNIFSSIHVEKTSLILFDEIETLTTDENFWSSLKKLLLTARKPIILTSNSRTNPEDAIVHLSKLTHYELIHLDTHESDLIEIFLRLILLCEMIEIPSLHPLQQLIQSSSGDLRQILNTLQFLLQSSDHSNEERSEVKEETNEVELQLQSSSTFDAMFYSRLNEQCNSSALKTFFHPLTQSFVERYDRTNAHFRARCQNHSDLYDTFKLFMQEEHISYIKDHPSFYLDYRPSIRQICLDERKRAEESNPTRRLRHALAFRGCSLQWSDFDILSTGLNNNLS